MLEELTPDRELYHARAAWARRKTLREKFGTEPGTHDPTAQHGEWLPEQRFEVGFDAILLPLGVTADENKILSAAGDVLRYIVEKSGEAVRDAAAKTWVDGQIRSISDAIAAMNFPAFGNRTSAEASRWVYAKISLWLDSERQSRPSD
ncbi:MAG TPA: hypothetical protein VHL59_07570 [Thermoanaerobaculia bacterium]|nr:hypothetical protein [Thermoanaerobaculia bacterium]